MSPFQLRCANTLDAGQIAQVFIEARTKCLAFLSWEYSLEVMTSVFQRQMEHAEFWIVESDSSVVGFISCVPDEVENLYVLPEFHRMHVGSSLLAKAFEQANPEIRLWVFQENLPARKFYERHGFTLEFETDGIHNMEKVPDARYVRMKQ